MRVNMVRRFYGSYRNMVKILEYLTVQNANCEFQFAQLTEIKTKTMRTPDSGNTTSVTYIECPRVRVSHHFI